VDGKSYLLETFTVALATVDPSAAAVALTVTVAGLGTTFGAR
jgi:hypothetical protein